MEIWPWRSKGSKIRRKKCWPWSLGQDFEEKVLRELESQFLRR